MAITSTSPKSGSAVMAVTLTPKNHVEVQAGDTVKLIVYVDRGVQIALPSGWTRDSLNPEAMYETRPCARLTMHQVAAGGFTWPTVALDQPTWLAWTGYVGRPPEGTEASYSWPTSMSDEISAAG